MQVALPPHRVQPVQPRQEPWALARQQGVQLLATLKTGDIAAAQQLARRLQAFGTLE